MGGAVEAAQDANSSVTADAAQREIVEQSKNAGVPAFSFDPDASPEEKRRQAQAAVPPELRKQNKAAAIVSDIDDGTGPDEDLPEMGKSGVIDVAKDAEGNAVKDADPEAKD